MSLRALEMVIEGAEYLPKQDFYVGGIGLSIEQALIQGGETWEPPEWAQRLRIAAAKKEGEKKVN